jgi:hypothetical protein
MLPTIGGAVLFCASTPVARLLTGPLDRRRAVGDKLTANDAGRLMRIGLA